MAHPPRGAEEQGGHETAQVGGKGRWVRACGEPGRWRSFVIHRVATAVARRRTGFEHVRGKRGAGKLIRQLQLHRFLLSGSLPCAIIFESNNIDREPVNLLLIFTPSSFFQLKTIERSLKLSK